LIHENGFSSPAGPDPARLADLFAFYDRAVNFVINTVFPKPSETRHSLLRTFYRRKKIFKEDFQMKKIAFIAAGVFFLACMTVNAQMDSQQSMKKPGMMRGGMGAMHGGMMSSSPMQSSMIMVNLLPEMQKQLSLSEDQAEELIGMRSEFKKQQVDYQAEMTKQNRKLQALIDNGAAAGEVRKQMKACADIRIDMHSAAYETEQKMKAVLTDEQQEQLDAIMEEHDDMIQKPMPKSRSKKMQ
jgi:Spy/CpxP family protein refolding chaperone